MIRRAPVGFPEATVLGAMPFRRPMTVGEVLHVPPLRYQSGGKNNYPTLKRVLDRLVETGQVDRVIRKPRTGRPALCYRRIKSLPR